MTADLYSEEIRSIKTSLLFVLLFLVFSGLFTWRVIAAGFRTLPIIYLFFVLLFGFYILNFRTLRIKINSETLNLHFGLVGWKTNLSNVASVRHDDSPIWIKMGGAGVHFALVYRKYRAFFNFLEYPRVLITFRKKQGLVRELVFTTKKPDKVIEFIQSKLGSI
jgi:hypothetical protein